MQERLKIVNPIVLGFIDVHHYNLDQLTKKYSSLFMTRDIMLKDGGECRFDDKELQEILNNSNISRKAPWRNSIKSFQGKNRRILGTIKRNKSISTLNGYSTFLKNGQNNSKNNLLKSTPLLEDKIIETESEIVSRLSPVYKTKINLHDNKHIIYGKTYEDHDGWYITNHAKQEIEQQREHIGFMAESDKKDSDIANENVDELEINLKPTVNDTELNVDPFTASNKSMLLDTKIDKPDIKTTSKVIEEEFHSLTPNILTFSDNDFNETGQLSNYYMDDIPTEFKNNKKQN